MLQIFKWFYILCCFKYAVTLNTSSHAGKLYGRGSTDDKGPVLAWFNVIEAFQKIGQVHTFITFLLNCFLTTLA